MKKIIIILVVVLVVGIFGYSKWSAANMVKKASVPYSTQSKAISFEIKPGESVGIVGANLKTEGLIVDSNLFTAYAKKMEVDKKIKAGIYTLNSNMSIKNILQILVSGERTEIWITIPEGWRIDQIGNYLEKQGITTSKEFQDRAYVKNFASTPFLSGLSGSTTLEGYLFPDTYRIFADTTVDQIIQTMLDGFANKVTKDIMDGANKKGFTLHQFITLTSIVEKESAHSEDIRKIASVYYNRLEQGMPFQSDATITYITRRADARPTIDETKVDSPYNTYLYKGLPPGPVGNPGLEAMMATLNPETTDYLFFVSKGNRAYFAKTYEEHLQNIAKYLD
ncbi:MAG: endolytic transglycosylase MltG [Patescibacteria group bacterium]|nr:endolytic transglycosylase MltG [Patescibacteria group bacterium]